MSGISAIGSSSVTTASYINPLDTNGDGVVDAQELQAAAQSGLLSASVLGDEDNSDPSAADKFSDSLAGMLLQMQESSNSQPGALSDGASSQSPIDQLFSSLDSNGDGKVSSDEFVAGRPKDMSADDAAALFKSLDAQGSGAIDKDQLAEGLNVLKPTDSVAADFLSLEPAGNDTGSAGADGSSSGTSSDDMLAQLEIAAAAYQNTYGQYDPSQTDDLLSA